MGIRDKLHIMVVDDSSVSRGLLSQSLDELGISNYTYESSGIKAYNQLSRRPVHLVLSDYHMPGMNGLELLQDLRQNPATKNIGFILVSGSPTTEIVNRAKSLRVNSILKKPWSTAQIRDCIQSVVGTL